MQRPRFHRSTTILIGIGLVLVGLLAGILTMLFVVDVRTGPSLATLTPRVVEPVELGQSEPLRPVAVTDSGTIASVASVPSLQAMNRLFQEVAQQVTPSVVYVQVEAPPAREWLRNFEGDDFHERFFREMPRQSVGSGVVISQEGHIVTNYHVVSEANAIEVTLADKRQFEAEVIGVDPSTDLAVLQVQTDETLPVAALGNSDRLNVGEWVLAVGNPFRLTSTVTAGIVSALGRQVNIIEDSFSIEDFIQTDAAINPGNSGGALVNVEGELVGISTAIATESGSYEGYGFAVPVNLVRRVVQDLITYGEVQRGFLGVSILPIDAQAAQELGLEEIGGVYITEARRGGAAYQGGVRGGDVVLAIDGQRVNAPNELQSLIARRRPGEQLSLQVWRDGQRRMLNVVLMGRDAPAYQRWFAELRDAPAEAEPEPAPEAPPSEGGVFQLSEWGLGLRELTRSDRTAFDTRTGAYLAYVAHGSAAHVAGLPRDVVILGIGGEDVRSVEEAIQQLGLVAGDERAVLFRVKRRDGVTAFYEVAVPTD
jgi:Do/DeqQ family serine protease